MENKSGILPMEYNVLVYPQEVQRTTRGGLHLPDETVERDGYARTEGILVAVSPLAFSYAEWPEGARKPRIGDRVMFARYNAHEVTGKDGQKYWLLKDQSISGIIADE